MDFPCDDSDRTDPIQGNPSMINVATYTMISIISLDVAILDLLESHEIASVSLYIYISCI